MLERIEVVAGRSGPVLILRSTGPIVRLWITSRPPDGIGSEQGATLRCPAVEYGLGLINRPQSAVQRLTENDSCDLVRETRRIAGDTGLVPRATLPENP